VMAEAGAGEASRSATCASTSPNGYTEGFVKFVAKVRERYPHLVIMAGNVVTGEMTEELILSGADIVRSASARGRCARHAR